MTSIIKALSLKNFKGFSDEVRIDLRPITLLFGANSAGKSSVLQALQYVREILERQNANADRTLQGGEAVDLGGFLNLVHGRDPQRQIEVKLEMELGATSIPKLVPDAFEDWQTQDQDVWWMYETLQTVRRAVRTVGVRLRIGWNEQREQPVVQGYEITTNGEWCLTISASQDGRDAQMRINQLNPIFMVDAPDGDNLLAELGMFVNPADLGEMPGNSDVSPAPKGPVKASVLSAFGVGCEIELWQWFNKPLGGVFVRNRTVTGQWLARSFDNLNVETIPFHDSVVMVSAAEDTYRGLLPSAYRVALLRQAKHVLA
jgi:hypothetical protein